MQSAEEAERAVAAARYPPRGVRGVARSIARTATAACRTTSPRADDEMCVLVQLETRASRRCARSRLRRSTASTACSSGRPISASLGYLGQPRIPRCGGRFEDACRRAQNVGTPIGILAPVEADARAYLDMGFNYVAVGSDVVTLRKGCDALVQLFKRKYTMKRAVSLMVALTALGGVWVLAQPSQLSIADEFRMVEVASVADAMEQLYGERAHMSHDMRPLSPTKFAGPAVTVQLKKEEHKEGSAASQGMLDAIDAAPAGRST